MNRIALIVIPGNMNYFYNLSGERVADALRELGMEVVVRTLDAAHDGAYDLCVISNITEVVLSQPNESEAIEQIQRLKQRSRYLACIAIDCVATHWFDRITELCEICGVDTILDLGLEDQSEFLTTTRSKQLYQFVLSGLTPTERKQFLYRDDRDSKRTIPWAFVGHTTPHRVALVDFLLRHIDSRGFVYLPELSAYKATGSPHLDQHQYERVLSHTRYQMWCSHHEHFYVEPERFRTSLLTGSVPIKIIASAQRPKKQVRFSYLMIPVAEIGERVSMEVFTQVRNRFRGDWQSLPSLSQSLFRAFDRCDVLPARAMRMAA